MSTGDNFRKFFCLGQKVRWFPGHMGKGFRQMEQKLRNIDCIIEVHDARIPMSGRNRNFQHKIFGQGIRPHILVLNKKDLLNPAELYGVRKQILQKEDIKDVILTNAKDPNCPGIKQLMPLATKFALDCDRPNRILNDEYHIMVIGVPNVGKSSILNTLRNKHMKKRKAALVGATAGVTRSVGERIKISEDPKIYMLDTPGILEPLIANDEVGMKLALVGCLPDHLVGEEIICDYLLYWLNKHGNFKYVDKVGLFAPCDDITKVLMAYACTLNLMRRSRTSCGVVETVPDLLMAARKFISLFRTNDFGKINLDQ